ncbi:hypothetical protein BDR03DRAFT_972916 [Suillus americanus]|nr:hypothetical protein BDR03DRAFT_972916 [Suillus americanus]
MHGRYEWNHDHDCQCPVMHERSAMVRNVSIRRRRRRRRRRRVTAAHVPAPLVPRTEQEILHSLAEGRGITQYDGIGLLKSYRSCSLSTMFTASALRAHIPIRPGSSES